MPPADRLVRLAEVAAQAIAESSGLQGPGSPEYAHAKAAVNAIFAAFATATSEEVMEAAADAYMLVYGQSHANGRERHKAGLRAASAVLLAPLLAEVARERAAVEYWKEIFQRSNLLAVQAGAKSSEEICALRQRLAEAEQRTGELRESVRSKAKREVAKDEFAYDRLVEFVASALTRPASGGEASQMPGPVSNIAPNRAPDELWVQLFEQGDGTVVVGQVSSQGPFYAPSGRVDQCKYVRAAAARRAEG